MDCERGYARNAERPNGQVPVTMDLRLAEFPFSLRPETAGA
jgi:hypothetical protein